MSKRIIITGGAGFIGSHVVRLFVNKYPDYTIINLDALTYAGNLENLRDIENKPNYRFAKVNILDVKAVEDLLGKPQEQKAEPKKEEVEPKSPLEQQYEEASQKKGEKAQQKAKEKLISDNFDGIVAQLMTKNKIKRQC